MTPETEGLRPESLIIPGLYERQKARGGYLTEADMHSVADEINQPLHKVQSVVSFFPHFRTTPPPKVQIHICRDMSCHLNGSVDLIDRMSTWASGSLSDSIQVCGVSCLGRCDRPAAAMINDQLVASSTETALKDAADAILRGEQPVLNSDWELAQTKVGAWEMDCYGGTGGYEIVRDYLLENNPERVLAALETANLLGMGGAGGRAYKKWGDVLQAESRTSEKFVVCNADESEPGTFKDREILLAAPHLIIEGMIVAAMLVGARHGWIYVRHEYPEQMERCRQEIDRATELGACGENIFGSGRNFHLHLFPSPGGYICGEQTALIEAMEGKRAEPRIRPPELQTNGLYQQPTLLSNVETFAWVPTILKDGGRWFAAKGIRDGPMTTGAEAKIKGKRLFAISGDVLRPGVYEVENGTTLGQLIDDRCGGMKVDKQIVAVALSGPSGGLLPAQIPVSMLNQRFVEANVDPNTTHINVRDLPLDINVSRVVGYMLGAGIVVYGTGCDVLAEAVANSRFYRNESCGKCVPCRIGSHKITDLGQQILDGKFSVDQLKDCESMARELGDVMTATSICGLGQVAATPIQSVLRGFPGTARERCRTSKGKK